jgi:hypothetical protein
MLKRGAAWLHARRHGRLSESVSYQRVGATEPTALLATRCRTVTDQVAEDQILVSGQTLDWIFRTEDFEGALGPFPEPRDTITASGVIFQVAGIGGEQAWRFSDEYDNAIRVHTVRL